MTKFNFWFEFTRKMSIFCKCCWNELLMIMSLLNKKIREITFSVDSHIAEQYDSYKWSFKILKRMKLCRSMFMFIMRVTVYIFVNYYLICSIQKKNLWKYHKEKIELHETIEESCIMNLCEKSWHLPIKSMELIQGVENVPEKQSINHSTRTTTVILGKAKKKNEKWLILWMWLLKELMDKRRVVWMETCNRLHIHSNFEIYRFYKIELVNVIPFWTWKLSEMSTFLIDKELFYTIRESIFN